MSSELLDKANSAFDRGDYAAARAVLSQVSESEVSAELRAAAAELRKRLAPDPAAIAAAIAGILFFAVVAFVYLR